ncbi:MAG TPA: flagellar export protein FliJ [Synergistaceae bacterium]|nr:flagellar export protein FliJ [Synergistaceae bacterium]
METRIHRFRRVRDVREKEKALAQEELARRRRQLQELAHAISDIEAEKEKAVVAFAELCAASSSLEEVWLRRRAIEEAQGQLADMKKNFSALQKLIAALEERLIERHKEVRLWDKLVSRMEEDQVREELSQEQKSLDEVALSRFLQNKKAMEGRP